MQGQPPATHPITLARTRIGRWAGNDIVLDNPQVSGAHAVLLITGTSLAIEDLGSKNGTYVAGARITRAPLLDGAVVTLGPYTLTLEAGRDALPYDPTLMERSATGAHAAWLLRLSGSPVGETIELTKVVTAIGDPAVCGVTCIRRAAQFAVRFTGGGRPARLNGTLLTEQPTPLQAGDVVEMDSGRLQFLIGKRPASS